MQSFGERLRHERETRNTTIEDIAAATGIHRGYLEALEKNEFQALPGRAFGKFYLRVYAEILEFDPDPLIVHYDRERHRDPPEPAERRRPEDAALRKVEASLARWREAKLAARAKPTHDESPEEPVDEPPHSPPPAESPLPDESPELAVASVEVTPAEFTPVEAIAPPSPARSYRPAAAVVLVVAAIGGAVGVYYVVSGTETTDRPAAIVAAAPDPPLAVGPLPLEPFAIVPAAAPAPAKASAPAPSTPSRLSVTEQGVGRRIVDYRLDGAGDLFTEGEVVTFATRVLRGRPGESIRHVWLHGGRAVQSIRLPIGAPDWRTHSTKTLWGAGSWTVEARDDAGRVLARATFTCTKAGR